MTPLAQSLLELDLEACALANICGESARGRQIKERVKAVRIAAANVRIADLAAHPDQVAPKDAVKSVVELALAAGNDFPAIVGWVNSVSDRRFGVEE